MEEEQISPLYIKGFNDGYILQQHEPELLSAVLKSDNPANEFLKAVKAGQKQYQEEKSLEAIRARKEQSKHKGLEHG